jgi:hypothetical protein
MITKPEILAMVQHILRRSRGLPDRRLMHPYREWMVITVTALVLVGASVAYSVHRFNYYAAIEAHVSAAPDAPVEFKTDTVDRALEFIEARRAAFTEASAGVVPHTPPAATDRPSATESSGTPALR